MRKKSMSKPQHPGSAGYPLWTISGPHAWQVWAGVVLSLGLHLTTGCRSFRDDSSAATTASVPKVRRLGDLAQPTMRSARELGEFSASLQALSHGLGAGSQGRDLVNSLKIAMIKGIVNIKGMPRSQIKEALQSLTSPHRLCGAVPCTHLFKEALGTQGELIDGFLNEILEATLDQKIFAGDGSSDTLDIVLSSLLATRSRSANTTAEALSGSAHKAQNQLARTQELRIAKLYTIADFVQGLPLSLTQKKELVERLQAPLKILQIPADQTVYSYRKASAGPGAESTQWLTTTLIQPQDIPRTLALPASDSYQAVSWILPRGTEVLEGLAAPRHGQPGGGRLIYLADPKKLKLKTP